MFGAKAGRSSTSFSRKENQESGGPRKLKCVPLPKPPFKEEANIVQIGRGRAGNFPLGFHMGESQSLPSGKSLLVKKKAVASGDMLCCTPKL